MASGRNGTLYVGVTSNLVKRIYEHKNGSTSGFAFNNGCTLLVNYELHPDMISAITREKQLKGGSRAKKLALIEATNPQWQDLYAGIL